MICQSYERVIVRRPPGTRYLQRYVLKTVKHPISIMIWGCISRNGRSQLKILQTGVHVNGGFPIFFRKEIIHLLDWPGNSPDINPIENAWFILMRKVGQTLPKGQDDVVRKIFISMGECYNTRTLREISYVTARQICRSNQKPKRSYKKLRFSNFLM